LLQEKENGGKQFKAIEVDGAKGYAVRQAFDPESNKGVEINYTGSAVELHNK
jgi:hypothetical protein